RRASRPRRSSGAVRTGDRVTGHLERASEPVAFEHRRVDAPRSPRVADAVEGVDLPLEPVIQTVVRRPAGNEHDSVDVLDLDRLVRVRVPRADAGRLDLFDDRERCEADALAHETRI